VIPVINFADHTKRFALANFQQDQFGRKHFQPGWPSRWRLVSSGHSAREWIAQDQSIAVNHHAWHPAILYGHRADMGHDWGNDDGRFRF
jgi:hypothetical protein